MLYCQVCRTTSTSVKYDAVPISYGSVHMICWDCLDQMEQEQMHVGNCLKWQKGLGETWTPLQAIS